MVIGPWTKGESRESPDMSFDILVMNAAILWWITALIFLSSLPPISCKCSQEPKPTGSQRARESADIIHRGQPPREEKGREWSQRDKPKTFNTLDRENNSLDPQDQCQGCPCQKINEGPSASPQTAYIIFISGNVVLKTQIYHWDTFSPIIGVSKYWNV